jgi:hypothetical protein
LKKKNLDDKLGDDIFMISIHLFGVVGNSSNWVGMYGLFDTRLYGYQNFQRD